MEAVNDLIYLAISLDKAVATGVLILAIWALGSAFYAALGAASKRSRR